jgi:hypothetical protein
MCGYNPAAVERQNGPGGSYPPQAVLGSGPGLQNELDALQFAVAEGDTRGRTMVRPCTSYALKL